MLKQNKPNNSNFFRSFTIFTIVAFSINIGVYIWGFLNKETTVSIFVHYSNIFTIIWSITASFSFVQLVYTFKTSSPPGKVWVWLSMGLITWLIGDLIWAYYELVLNEISPFPSVGDYSWTLGYPFLIIGIFLQLRLANIRLPKKEIIIIIVIELVLILIASITVLIPIFQEPISEDFTQYQKIFSLFYPIGDLILAPFAIALIFKYRGGEFSKVWFIIAIGFILAIIADLAFAYYDWNELDTIWYFVDLFFIAYYMVFAIGSQYLKQLIK